MIDERESRMRILVAEDDYFLAEALQAHLVFCGVTVVGPLPSVSAALEVLSTNPSLDGALLDVNLGGQLVFELADELVKRNIRIVFTTGYERSVLPERFRSTKSFTKPYDVDDVLAALRS